ncbi:Thymidine kinase [Entamoeba marina]
MSTNTTPQKTKNNDSRISFVGSDHNTPQKKYRNDPKMSHDGSIQLILGPMFSGKTTELIRIIRRYTISKKKTMMIKYSKDTRYGKGAEAISHDKGSWKAYPTTLLMDLKESAMNYDVIGIDEGQFFNDVREFSELMADYGKKMEHTKKKPFGQILEMIPLAESVKKLKAVCMYCGIDAAFSLRTTAEQSVEVIGGADKYCAVCRKCYNANNIEGKNHRITEFTKSTPSKKTIETRKTLERQSSLMISSLEDVSQIA